jgi:Helix-turn-helix domain/Resolvase, N terminal domain
MLTVLAGIAEFERELIKARTGEGRKRAQARGVRFGRPRKLTPHQRREALARLDAGETQAEIARTYNVDASTIGRLLQRGSEPIVFLRKAWVPPSMPARDAVKGPESIAAACAHALIPSGGTHSPRPVPAHPRDCVATPPNATSTTCRGRGLLQAQPGGRSYQSSNITASPVDAQAAALAVTPERAGCPKNDMPAVVDKVQLAELRREPA